MNKKRRAALVMALFLAMVGSATAARAEAEFDGEVVASETQVISVPCSGQLESIEVQEGQWVSEGEAVAEMKVTKVFATTDGTVRGIFYQVGDSLESGAGASGQTTGSAENAGGEDNSQSADGTVMYIAPVSRYTVNATIDDAYNRAANKYVRIGETVYMKCVKDGSHRAVGTIVAVDGSGYTVETTGGELYMEETVYIYRDSDYSSSTRIGSGTVTRTQEVAVQGTGTLLKLYVEDGEEVERGQLLFETIEDSSEGQASSTIYAHTSGAVASIEAQAGDSVQQGSALVKLYPASGYQVKISVPEDMLSEISQGDQVEIRFNWDEDGSKVYSGTVESISYVSENQTEDQSNTGQNETTSQTQASGEASYSAYIQFEADESVRLGMSVLVTVE